MDNNSMNYDILHTFFEGYKVDLEEHAEGNKSFVDAVNGRLFSQNGVLSWSSLNGTRKVYENASIKKYLGWCAFKDELIMFTKCDPLIIDQPLICEDETTITTNPVIIDGVVPPNVFSNGWSEQVLTICRPDIPVDENDFITPVSCVSNESDVNDYGNLFWQSPLLPVQYCPVYNNDLPINNTLYKDGIWSFKYNENRVLEAKLVWYGNLNLAMDAKICTFGVEENNSYKRVYFTDYLNEFRVLNLKDKKLSVRQPEEFGVNVNGTLLSPRIVAKRNNGNLPAMSVCYLYRLITENGQVSDFSAASPMVKVNKEDGDYQFAGGGTSETTSKSILVSAIVPDYINFSEIELIAVEYEALLIPTTIRTVGRKPVGFYNEFEHFGTEPEFLANITLADIFANSISWKYCSDIESKNNKLLAVGLRNDPAFVNSKEVDIDFALHGFHFEDGETHNCLLNPNPIRYNYINNSMTEPFMFIYKKIYRHITAIGNFWVRIENKLTGNVYQLDITDGTSAYSDYTERILNFLLDKQSSNPIDFENKFPNLKIDQSQGKILFLPRDPAILTDFYNYRLIFSTNQVLVDYDSATQMRDFPWPTTDTQRGQQLLYGGISNGWFNGNGVKVTIQREHDNVMTKHNNWYEGGPILKIKEPTLKKGVMKGEIYRIGIQWFKNGTRLFTTILGDIKIPDIGQRIREMNDFNEVFEGTSGNNLSYQNFVVENDDMLAVRLMLRFDVRISCELSRQVDAYQIVYVERTEDNRSILAQGISAPLHRMLEFDGTGGTSTTFDEKLTNKWNLPYYGGPIIDHQGLENYNVNPDNDDLNLYGANYNWKTRVVTHRKLIYFDSPDLIYNRISSKNIESCVLEYLYSIRTDHDRHNIVGGYNQETSNNNNQEGVGTALVFADGTINRNGDVTVPFGPKKFSQKIPFSKLGGVQQIKPFFVNVSVFANQVKTKKYPAFTDDFTTPMILGNGGLNPRPDRSAQFDIDKSASVNEGEIVSGFRMNESFDLANSAAALTAQASWYQRASRISDSSEFSVFRVNNVSDGRPTVFLKTSEDFYTPYVYNNDFMIYGNRSFGTADHNTSNDNVLGNDTHIISNIKKNNAESIYGGRTEYAYSVNEYIAMSEVMPVIFANVASQIFFVQGDVYCNAFIRNKSSYHGSTQPESTPFNYRDDISAYNRYGAWCYAVVLETMVEPRLNHSEEFYRLDGGFAFNMSEAQNKAYFQNNDLKKSIPKPVGFKDDPNQSNIVAVSNVKLSGDYYDAFTRFPTNEFYELEKDKGAALNIIRDADEVYVVQELQTSKLFIDERSFITPDDGGKAIQVAQSNGGSISGHQVVSEYGTSFRRALILSDFGFTFYDERKKEFVRQVVPLFVNNQLSLFMNKYFDEHKVLDCEGYYDDKHKETNIRFRMGGDNPQDRSSYSFIISYNEVLKCFNGKFEMNNDIYAVFQQQVIAPYASSSKLGELNTGNVLEFFEQPKNTLKLSFISAPDAAKTKIFKGLAVHINTNYPIQKTTFETSLGQIKSVLGTHHWYRIREGVHTMPAKNPNDVTDIRGEWVKITFDIESLDNKKIDIFSVVNYVRNSYK